MSAMRPGAFASCGRAANRFGQTCYRGDEAEDCGETFAAALYRDRVEPWVKRRGAGERLRKRGREAFSLYASCLPGARLRKCPGRLSMFTSARPWPLALEPHEYNRRGMAFLYLCSSLDGGMTVLKD